MSDGKGIAFIERMSIPEPNTAVSPRPNRGVHAKRIGKPCRNCGGTLRYGGSYSCVPCTNKRSMERKKTSAYKAQAKRYWMDKRYGLSPQEMAAMLKEQGDKCACCGTSEPRSVRGWVIDHDHATGKIRGILCDACNVGLGRFDDCTEKLEAAIRYLQRHKEIVHRRTWKHV